MNAPSNVTIRRGSVADAPALAEFAARTFVETFGSQNNPDDLQLHLASAYGVAQQTAELRDPHGTTLLATDGDVLTGYAQIRRGERPSCVPHADAVEVRRFYVDTPAHGTGLAARLMTEAYAAARELGGRHLWLGVWERNTRGIAFYRKMGFVDVGSHDFLVGNDRQTDRVLIRSLED